MKRTIFFFLLVFLTFAATAQTIAQKTADGNLQQVETPAKTADELTANCEKSAAKFTDKAGKTHQVYLTKNGKTFYVATSKAGKPYRRYFKVVGE